MTLLVGGPRHGYDLDLYEPQSVLDIATDQPRKPPQSYVDLASATTYHLRQFQWVTAHPLTGQPDRTYANDVYVHETLGPAEATQALHLAVLGLWFVKEGTLQPVQQPGTTPPNGTHRKSVTP